MRMREADAVVFGYKSTGIPRALLLATTADDDDDNQQLLLLNGWVQIPSRSSINVVAAMSIVLDALMIL